MTWIIAGILVLLFLLSKYLVFDKLSKIFIYLYLTWWSMWLILSTFDVYELFTVRPMTYFLILLGLLMFLVGFISGFSKKQIQHIDVGQIHHINIKKNKVYHIILLLSFLMIAYYFTRYMVLSTQLPTDQLRIIRFSVGELFTSTEQLLFFNFFIEPFVFVLYAVVAYMIIHRQMKNVTFLMSIATLGMYAGIGSGRLPIIYLLMALIFMFLLSRINPPIREISDQQAEVRFRRLLKSSFYVLLAVFPILLVYASWLTAFRYGQTVFTFDAILLGFNELMKQFIVYFTGPFRALDYGIIHHAEEIPYLYGQATLAGVNELFHAVFHVIGIEIQNINYLIGEYLQNRSILVGNNIFFNYAYTYIMIFYFDLGVIGVIVLSFFFGLFARKIIFMFNEYPSIPSLVLLVYYFLAVIFSVFSWLFQSPAAILLIIISIILHKILLDRHKKQLGGTL